MSGTNAAASCKPLRILLLEDSALDGELIASHLAGLGEALELHRVWTRDAFLDALSRQAPDVILADHVLPQFDGDTALELAQQIAPQVPFIFVSGTLTEELAVKALKRGATDYVVKQRLQRLPEAVQRAIGEARERAALRHAQQALHASGERLQAIIDALPVLIAYADANQRYGLANVAYKDWFGLDPEVVKGRHVREVIGEAAYQRLRPAIERVLRGERVSIEGTLPFGHASLRQVQIEYVPERQPDGRVTG